MPSLLMGSGKYCGVLFVKVVIADSLAHYVDEIFTNYAGYTGSTLLVGVIVYGPDICRFFRIL